MLWYAAEEDEILSRIESNQISEIETEKIGDIKTTSVKWVWWYITPTSANWFEDETKNGPSM